MQNTSNMRQTTSISRLKSNLDTAIEIKTIDVVQIKENDAIDRNVEPEVSFFSSVLKHKNCECIYTSSYKLAFDWFHRLSIHCLSLF